MIDKICNFLTDKIKQEMPEIFNDISYNENFPKEKYAKITMMKGE